MPVGSRGEAHWHFACVPSPRGSRKVIVQAILAAVFRSAGKLLNTAFGWATVMRFGRVSQDRQLYLSLVSFGSVIWLVALLGIAFPKLGPRRSPPAQSRLIPACAH
jgi:hypothetical protein